MSRTVNIRVLVAILAVIVVVAGSVHLLHGYQARRNAGEVLRQAETSFDEGRLERAAQFFHRYLFLEPNDVPALAKYALTLDGMAATADGRLRAMLLLDQVLRRDPHRQDIRYRLAHQQIALGRLAEAIDNLEQLVPAWPRAGELEHLLGWCHEARGSLARGPEALNHHEKAATWFRHAIAAAPERVESYLLLAEVLQERLADSSEAAKVLDGLIAANPLSFRAYLERARYFKRTGAPDRADEDLRQAVRLAPENAEVHKALAVMKTGDSGEHGKAEHGKAEVAQRQRLAHHHLGELYKRRFLVEANLAFRQAEGQMPLDAALCRLGADIALANRDTPRAVALARRAVAADGTDYRDFLWLGRVLASAGAHADAEAALRQAVTWGSHTAEPLLALVEHLVQTGQSERAEAALGEGSRQLPQESASPALARGQELLGRLDRAEELYRQAHQARPDDFILLLQAADFFRRGDRPAEAEPFLRKLLVPALGAPPEVVVRARRHLAVDLARRHAGGRAEAVQLLDANQALPGHAVADVLARAAVLGTQTDQRQQALRTFAEVLKKHTATAAELFLLARLLEADGQRSRARELLLDLHSAEPGCPQYLAAYVRCLIASGELDDAAVYLGKLEIREPRGGRTRELHAALLKARSALADPEH